MSTIPTGPYGRAQDQASQHPLPIYFKDNHLKIVAFDHRYLIVRVATPYLRCLIVAAHAPHTGHDDNVIKEWWSKLQEAIPATLSEWPIILLSDANATVGTSTSKHVGDFQFEAFICQHDLWLPATFAECQLGQGATWTHTSGSSRRIDYVGLPLSWSYQRCTTWVSETIGPTIVRGDHSAVCAEVVFTLARPTNGFTPDWGQAERLAVDPNAVNWQGLVPLCHSQLDVHSHLQQLQDALATHLRHQQKRKDRKPVKQTLSEQTWELVCTKRHWRKALADHVKLQRTTFLEGCFAAWRHQRSDLGSSYGELTALQDKLIAQALAEFRHYGLLVTKAMRADDRAFFDGLLKDGAEFLEPRQVKQLWAVVRRSLPKFRNHKVGYSPHKLAHLEEQSARHFEDLEIGLPTPAKALLAKCLQDQADAAWRDLPSQVAFSSIPSLPEVEDALRATQADRATGFDAVPSSVYHKHAAFLGRY